MKRKIEKVETLLEALPYIKKFRDEKIVGLHIWVGSGTREVALHFKKATILAPRIIGHGSHYNQGLKTRFIGSTGGWVHRTLLPIPIC